MSNRRAHLQQVASLSANSPPSNSRPALPKAVAIPTKAVAIPTKASNDQGNIKNRLKTYFREVWTNRHGPKLQLFGPRYPNTIEFKQSPEGQQVYAKFERINDAWVNKMGDTVVASSTLAYA